MKLKFEHWIEQNNFNRNVINLFNSSVSCYKAQVYSASLLMAYLGFLSLLKERVMKAEKPNLFPDYKWEKLLLNLKNEDNWEQAIFDAVLKREKPEGTVYPKRTEDPVFVINENIRIQIRYWKDRRNDCVHNKDNIITIYHVENFWSFLESNLPKITIEGGRITLLNKFKTFFDSNYTAANEDITPLLTEIRNAVHTNELDDFWANLFPIANNIIDYNGEILLAQKILKLDDDILSESLISYIRSNESFLRSYIQLEPSFFLRLNYTKQEVRNFWKTELINMANPMPAYAMLLRNNLIPMEDIKEANKNYVLTYKYPDSAEDHQTLQENGFGEALYNYLFVKHNQSDFKYWQFMNDHYRLYIKFIEKYELKEEVVKVLCEELGKEGFTSFFLRDSLNIFLLNNNYKKLDFVAKAKKIGAILPQEMSVFQEIE